MAIIIIMGLVFIISMLLCFTIGSGDTGFLARLMPMQFMLLLSIFLLQTTMYTSYNRYLELPPKTSEIKPISDNQYYIESEDCVKVCITQDFGPDKIEYIDKDVVELKEGDKPEIVIMRAQLDEDTLTYKMAHLSVFDSFKPKEIITYAALTLPSNQ